MPDLPPGMICVENEFRDKNDNSWVFYNHMDHALIFVPIVKQLEFFIDDCSTEGYFPVVILKKNHDYKPVYRGNFLIPPGIDINSPRFSRTLNVPDLRIERELISCGKILGYLLKSDYVREQLFFCYPDKLPEINPHMKMVGWIKQMFSNRNRKPEVEVLTDSVSQPELFEENEARLGRILKSEYKFWWNV